MVEMLPLAQRYDASKDGETKIADFNGEPSERAPRYVAPSLKLMLQLLRLRLRLRLWLLWLLWLPLPLWFLLLLWLLHHSCHTTSDQRAVFRAAITISTTVLLVVVTATALGQWPIQDLCNGV